MTLTTHALVGAAAASFFPEQPYLAFAAGFASHFAVDALPHWDYSGYLRSLTMEAVPSLSIDMRWGKEFRHDLALIGGDALLGFALTFAAAALLRVSPEIALIGAGAGVYPDLMQFVYYKIRKTAAEPALHRLQLFHLSLQRERQQWGWKKGLAMQAALVAGIYILLITLR